MSFLLVGIISLLCVVFIFRSETTLEVRRFIVRGPGVGLPNITSALEGYYSMYGTWDGVDTIFQAYQRLRGPGMPPGQGMSRGENALRWRLLDPQGGVLYDTDPRTQEKTLDLSRFEENVVAIVVEDRTVGYLLPEINAEFEERSIHPLMDRINRAAGLAALIAAVIAFLVAIFLSYSLLRPVNALTKAAGRLGSGDLTQRVPVQGADELAKLSRAFNRMAESLENAETSRRAMTADIAHELRTPLAVQRAQLEAMMDGVYEMSPENLEIVLAQSALLSRLVEDLRTLTLADTGELQLEKVEANFPEVILRSAEQFHAQADWRNIVITTDLDSTCPPLRLDTARVEQILVNLLSNAIRHTPDGGRISLSLICENGQALLRVHDNGPGIPPESLSFIFDRFYRADKARSRQEGGSGLGLTIARKLARAHGGDLSADNHPLGGAVFILSIPLS